MPESNAPSPENGQPIVTPAAPGKSDDVLARLDTLAGRFESFLKTVAPGTLKSTGTGADGADAASTSLASRLTPRMLACLFLAGVLVAGLAIVSPQQLPVAGYKLCLVVLAGLLGYWLDRWLFPYARPDGYLAREWRAHGRDYPDSEADYAVVPGYETVFAAALLRRALVVLGAMLGLGLGL
ncbi:hypothetical protein DesfrDRAFT_0146 [Solidesulfovibrio fructosivorans JJ]]|uniref:Uncharacterized protein n=1 Tax=Solidesulfovibrio fructosivorans JJ] TaxID=596151 RepID=E1JR97_SOLFR|nr:putative holin [Solidesulfovibrio fructosivorans]EFL53098.1 hypothetical protein DesfrDRAFT_0146 [Solidesulfovibrio fructosivorans JJ]]